MVDFSKLTNRAKQVVQQRGGMDSVKKDAGQLRDIARQPGSATDKVKAAAAALREPGGPGTSAAAQTHATDDVSPATSDAGQTPATNTPEIPGNDAAAAEDSTPPRPGESH